MADTPASLFVIDTLALIYRMFHAVGEMSAPDGRPTNAIFGVTRSLVSILDEDQPTYLVCAMDPEGKTFRDDYYPEYKSHRDPPPDDLVRQIPPILEIMHAMRIPVLCVPGYEADDVMATVAVAASQQGIKVSLCTSDKDCRQLIDDRVRLYDLKKKTYLDRNGLMDDWGVTPEQVVDLQTLVGDSVDNVPGIKGVGVKTAAKLLAEYQTIGNLLANVDNIKQPKLKENIKAAAGDDTLVKSRYLVELRKDVPLDIDWNNWKVQHWDAEKLLEIFEGHGFRSLTNRVRGMLKSQGKAKNTELMAAIGLAPPKPQGHLFSHLDDDSAEHPFDAPAVEAPPPEPVPEWVTNYTLVDTPDKWTTFLVAIRSIGRFAIDLETTGLDAMNCEIVGIAISWKATEAAYIPVKAPANDPKLSLDFVLADLKPILEDPKVEKVNQNIKYDLLVLKSHGIETQGVVGDSMLAHYLLHSGDRTHGLDELTLKYFKHENISITELIGKGKNQKKMDQVPTAKVRDYAAEDADAAWRLCERLEAELKTENLWPIYETLEMPLIRVLAEVEATGIRIDVPFLNDLSKRMTDRLAQLESDIHREAGKEFNIASLNQLRDILYLDLKLPILKRTELTNEPSTDQETLEKLAVQGHAVPKLLIEHRQISKLKGTYVDTLPLLVNPRTKRIHSSFNQTIAATGRLSSSDPNLQNIPARSDLGQEIRQAFIPREGWTLLTADYSQIELRMLAHFCGDENLRKAFVDGRDIHALVAGEVYGVAESAVTPEQRRVAKTVNFGVIYGMSAFGLAARLGIDRSEAKKFIENYFARYPKVQSYQDDLLKRARANGYVPSILGRRRKFDPNSIRVKSSYHGRNQAEREAINMEIQSSAADLIKLAMIHIHDRLKAENREAKMLLSVHDELVFEVPPGEIADVAKLVREEMVGAMTLGVPLDVDVSAGPNWLTVEEV
jgi:DNA polymerase I